MSVFVTWQTNLPPAPPFSDGYSLSGSSSQHFDWTRGVRYQAIAAPGVGGIEVTDLATMAVTLLVTFDSMYAGTPYGNPAGSPPSQSCLGLVCGNDTDVYLVMNQGSIYRRLARVDPDTWKVIGEFYVDNTITGSVYGASVECTNVAGGNVIVGSNGNYIVDKAQLFDGTTMAFLWYGAPATYFGSTNKILIPGATNDDGSCDFWIINSDLFGTSGNIDFWRITVDAALSVTETLVFTLTWSPGVAVALQRVEWDDAHARLLVWIAPDASSAPTLISVGTTGTIAWTYTATALSSEVQGGHGNSRLEGASIGVVTSLGHVALVSTETGALIEADALTLGSSDPPYTGNLSLGTSFYDAWDSATRTMYTYVLAFGAPAVSWGPPPVTTILNMAQVRVTSLASESPCTAAQFSPEFEAVGPSLGLRWSDTRGKTFGNAVPQEFSNDPLWQPQWNRTGMARDRVFELFWSAAYKTALNGAFVEVTPLKS